MKTMAVVISSLLFASSAFAGPVVMTDHELDGVVAGQGVIGAGFSAAPPGTVGPSISGDLYGNTSNPRPSGHGVLPSLSPGPWLCAGANCNAQPTEAGPSMGTLLAPLASGGNGNPDFANGKSPGPDFTR